jgi:hypothetical protein
MKIKPSTCTSKKQGQETKDSYKLIIIPTMTYPDVSRPTALDVTQVNGFK